MLCHALDAESGASNVGHCQSMRPTPLFLFFFAYFLCFRAFNYFLLHYMQDTSAYTHLHAML